MIRSEIDKRAKRTVPRQCVSDYGMHKDAPSAHERVAKTRRYAPLKDELRKLQERSLKA